MELKELYDGLVQKVADAVEAVNGGKSATEVKAAKKTAKDALAQYNGEVAVACYKKWAEDGNVVETACRVRFIPGIKRINYKTDDKTGVTTGTIADGTAKASLVDILRIVGGRDFHSPDWFDRAQKLAFILANALNEALGKNPAFVYQVEAAAQAFNFADNADPRSTASIVKALQSTVDAIHYVPVKNKKDAEVNSMKVTSQHWAYIENCMTAQGKNVGEVCIGNTHKMAELIADVIHLIMTGKTTFVSQA